MMADMNSIMKVLVSDFGFEPVGDIYETYEAFKNISFERGGDVGSTLLVQLMKPYRGYETDWIIAPGWETKGDDRLDYAGLTLREYDAFKAFIEEFEKGASNGRICSQQRTSR